MIQKLIQQLLLCLNEHFGFQIYYTQKVSYISGIKGNKYPEKEAIGRFLIYSADGTFDRFLIYPA